MIKVHFVRGLPHIIHEFSHFLGFGHEGQRIDAHYTCGGSGYARCVATTWRNLSAETADNRQRHVSSSGSCMQDSTAVTGKAAIYVLIDQGSSETARCIQQEAPSLRGTYDIVLQTVLEISY